MRASAEERRYQKFIQSQMDFAERAHKRQMLGNVATSFFQSLAANRPLQVGTAIGLHRLGRAAESMVKGEQKGWAKAFDDLGGFAIDAGLVAYLANSDGGVSIQYDVPDVESPRGGGLASNGGDFFLPADPARGTKARRR